MADLRFKIQQLDAGAAHWLGWAKKEVRRLAELIPAFTRTWVHGDVTVRAQYHEGSGTARLWLAAAGTDWLQEARFELQGEAVDFARSDLVLVRNSSVPYKITLLWRDANGVWGGRGRSEEGAPLTSGDEISTTAPWSQPFRLVFVSDDGMKVMFYGARISGNSVFIALHTATWSGAAWAVVVGVEEELYWAGYTNLHYQMDASKQSGVFCVRTGTDAITTFLYAQGVKTVREEMPASIVTPLYDYADVVVKAYSKDRMLFNTYAQNGEPSSYVNETRWVLEEQLPGGATNKLHERTKGGYYSSWNNGASANDAYYEYTTTYTAAGGARTVYVYDDDGEYHGSLPSGTYLKTRTVGFTVRSCVSGTWEDVLSQTGSGLSADPLLGGYPFNIVKSFTVGYHGGLFLTYESNGNETEHSGSTYTYPRKYTCYCYVDGAWKSAVLHEGEGGTYDVYSITAGMRNAERGTSDYTFAYRVSSNTLPPYFGGDHDVALVSWVGGELQQVTTFKQDSGNDITYQTVVSKDGRTAFLWTDGGVKQLWSRVTGEWKQVFSRSMEGLTHDYARVSDDGKTVLIQHEGSVTCWSCVPGAWVEVAIPGAATGFISEDATECCAFYGVYPTSMWTVKFVVDALQEEPTEAVQQDTIGPRTTYYVQLGEEKITVAKKRLRTGEGSSIAGRYSDNPYINRALAITAVGGGAGNGLLASDVSAGFGQSMSLRQLPADVPDGAMWDVRYVPPEVVEGKTYARRLVLLYSNAVRIFRRVGAAFSSEA